MIDTHAHIDADAFDGDRAALFDRAESAGVEYIIVPAIQPKGFDKLFEVVYSRKNLFCSVGVHPHHALEAGEAEFDNIERLCSNSKMVAIGEAGLDYFYDFAPKDIQRDVFIRQLRIAKNARLPIIVHNRDSDEDLLKIIEQEQDGSLTGVLHCFSGSAQFLEKALDLGFLVSFTGNITFKNTNLSETVKQAPIEKIMLETDSPYMTPVPYRGKRNEPAYVKLIAEKIAEYKSLTLEEVISMTSKNAKMLFNLSVLLVVFLAVTFAGIAQTNNADDYDDEPVEKFENYYKRFIGFGPLIGANTVVQTQYVGDKELPISYEGLVTVGGAVSVGILNFLNLEAAYSYSKNTLVARQNDNRIDPTYHHIVELDAQWIVNPGSKINFFATSGIVAFFNNINKVQSNKLGMNFGVGVCGNIKLPGGAGMLVPTAEIRINYAFGRENMTIYFNKNLTEVESSSYFSIPRFTLFWFPNL